MVRTEMPGLYTGDIGSVAEEQLGTSAVATTPGDVLSARASSGFAATYPARIFDAFAGAAKQQVRSGGDEFDLEIANPLSADDANKQFGIPGALKFDKDTDAASAKALYDEKHGQLVRQDRINRANGAFGSGAVPQFVAEFAANMLDPIGLAAGVVPIFGEAVLGARLAQAGSALGRFGVRAVAGGIEGAAGMAALEPLNYVLDAREHNDWTMGHALRNLAFGAVLVGGLHSAGGALADRALGRYRPAPEDHAFALRGSVAQVMEGEPVTVAQALDTVQASRAESDLRAFAQRQTEITDRTAVRGDQGAPDRGAAIAQAEGELRRLRIEAFNLENEGRVARERQLQLSPQDDEATGARLAAVETDLQRVQPKARRAELEAERKMLLRGGVDETVDPLEAARFGQQAEGLEIAQTLAEKRQAAMQERLDQLHAADAEATSQAQAGIRSDEAAVRRDTILNASKREVLQSLTERTVRRYAAAYGVALDPTEARMLAREVMSAAPGETADAVNAVLKDLRERSPTPGRAAVEASPAGAVDAGSAALRSEGTAAGTSLTEALRNPPETPATAQGREIAIATAERAPKIEGAAEKQIAEVDKLVADLDAQIKGEVAAGRMTESEMTALQETIDTLAKGAEEDVSLFQSASACILGNSA